MLEDMSMAKSVTFVIPVYNEELNIPRVLHDLYSILKQHPEWNPEVIVIEDGSADHTREAILKTVKEYPQTQLILHEKNLGYTHSLKDGIARATGKFVMYVGADEEFDCSELPSFIEPLLTGAADVVLGVRWQRNSYQLFRFFLSVIYIFLLNYLFKLRVNDYNWSQAWCRELLDIIEIRSRSLFALPEIIIKAHDLKYRIIEVPSNHKGRHFGKSSVHFGIMAHALWDAVVFWHLRRSKRYQPALSRTTLPAPKLDSVTGFFQIRGN